MGTFDVWDFTILVIILLISALIGIYYRYTGGRQKTTKEYLMADQSMTVFPVSFSLMASFMSAITLLGVSNESYQFGTMFCVINLSYIISTPIAAYYFLPVFYHMRTTSIYEYLERRFGHATRLACSLAYSVQMILYMGIVLYAPAIALEAVTGISTFTAILIIGLVCTFYSTIGGLKAVLITDVFQSLLMFAAIYAVIVVSAIKAGGLAPIWDVAYERGRIYFTDISLDPTVRHTWWSLIIGGMITYLSLYGVNQVQVQRLLSVHNLKDAQSALWWNLPILSCLSFSTIFSGLAIFWYYKDCDPKLDHRIKSRDQLLPLFAVETMGQYPGLCGLFVSGIFSASLSTVSSAVCSLSAVTLEDYLKPLYRKIMKRPMHETQATLPTKIIAFFYGLLCILLAFGAGQMGSVLQASLTIFGVVGGPLLAIFTLGMFTTKANQRGVLLGLVLGLAFSFCIGFGGPKPAPTSLDFNTDGCNAANVTTATLAALSEIETVFGGENEAELAPKAYALLATEAFNVSDNNVSAMTTSTSSSLSITTSTTPPTPSDDSQYYWLYRLSYMWFSVLGFLITFILGYIASLMLAFFGWADNSQIYLNDAQTKIDYDLFVPSLARRLKEQAAIDELTKLNNCDNNMSKV